MHENQYHTHPINTPPEYNHNGYSVPVQTTYTTHTPSLCTSCGQWVVSGSFHQCPYAPVQFAVAFPAVPQTTNTAILEELKLMRKALETLVERTGNDHEEVRGRDNGRGERSASDTERGLEGLTLGSVAEVAKRLGI